MLRASDGVWLNAFPVGRDIAFDGANIWVANYSSSSVTELSASDGTEIGTFSAGGNPFGVAFDGGNIWVTNFSGVNVSKL